jgi:hypothetical protein
VHVKKLVRDTRGAAYIEFLITIIPITMMFLGMVQMALLYAGHLVVQRAASAAVRAAIVVLDDDPQHYGGEQRMALGGGGSGSGSLERVLEFLTSNGMSGGDPGEMATISGGSSATASGERAAAVRTAASMTLMAVAPPPGAFHVGLVEENVRGALGVPSSRAASALYYNTMATAVTFPDGPGEAATRTSWSRTSLDEDGGVPTPVRIRVSYMFHCAVPLANRLMCNDGAALAWGASAAEGIARAREVAAGRDSMSAFRDAMSQRSRDEAHLTRSGVGLQDLRTEQSAGLSTVAGMASSTTSAVPRFKVISAEAQMPIHYAGYCYRSEGNCSL